MKLYFFIGTTAEFIKVSPVLKELKRRNIKYKIITSGQGNILYSEFKTYLGTVIADIKLPYKGDKSSLINFLFWTIKSFYRSIIAIKAELAEKDVSDTYMIVHGDTVSSLIGALVSKIFGLKLIHIESGLRSFNFFEPFPEELTRYIISNLAQIHFCPNSWCLKNLESTGGAKINTFQNTLLDIFSSSLKDIKSDRIKLPFKKYFVLVIHRQEHILFNKNAIKTTFQSILKNKGNINCVLIKHDLTEKLLNSIGITDNDLKKNHVYVLPRLSYLDFMSLINRAQYFITDGGSNQEESFYLGKPCLILRKYTERIEGLKKNAVLSCMEESVIQDFMKNYQKYRVTPIKNPVSPSKIIVDYLQKKFL